MSFELWGMTAEQWAELSAQAASSKTTAWAPVPEPISFDVSLEEFKTRMTEVEELLAK